MILNWIKQIFTRRKPKTNKTKNIKLLILWKEFQNIPFPEFDTQSEKLSDMISDLALYDTNLAGYIHTYIFYGKYNKGSKHPPPREGIKIEVASLKGFLVKFKKINPKKEDTQKFKLAIKYMKDIIRISEMILNEERIKMKKKDLDEEEIYLNYIVALHKIAEEKRIKTEILTMDKELTEFISKLAEAEFKKDKKKEKEYKRKSQDRIKFLCKN